MKRKNISIIYFFTSLLVLGLTISAYAAAQSDIPEVEYTFPYIGNRVAIWIISEVHLLFGAFILGTPIFIVVCEYIGMRTKDMRYERLAKEVTKVTLLCYAFTVLFGGMFAMFLFALYPKLSAYLLIKFFPIAVGVYSILWVIESTLMYIYWYTWDTVGAKRKGLHLTIGIAVNISGFLTMAAINSVASFMLTPPRPVEGATLWQLVNNATWIPLILHRLLGNICFGGFIAAMIAAYMSIMSKTEEDKAFYDWQGFVGTLIGMAFLLPIPIMGYIYSLEIYKYGAEIGVYQMSDRLSKFYAINGILTGLLFLGANYYIWLSMKRITGAERFRTIIKAGFIVVFISNLIWVIPRHFIATMILEPGMGYNSEAEMVAQAELPNHLAFLALMPAKNIAVTLIILVTLLNYILYWRALKTGKIVWGKIDAMADYVLIFQAFTVIWLMAFMGPVRELNRKFYHVYMHIKDYTPDAFSPTLAYSSVLTTIITWVFFGLLSLAIWLMLHKNISPQKSGSHGD